MYGNSYKDLQETLAIKQHRYNKLGLVIRLMDQHKFMAKKQPDGTSVLHHFGSADSSLLTLEDINNTANTCPRYIGNAAMTEITVNPPIIRGLYLSDGNWHSAERGFFSQMYAFGLRVLKPTTVGERYIRLVTNYGREQEFRVCPDRPFIIRMDKTPSGNMGRYMLQTTVTQDGELKKRKLNRKMKTQIQTSLKSFTHEQNVGLKLDMDYRMYEKLPRTDDTSTIHEQCIEALLTSVENEDTPADRLKLFMRCCATMSSMHTLPTLLSVAGSDGYLTKIGALHYE